MVIILAGSFMMGSTDAEIEILTMKYGDDFKHQSPQHKVTIPRPLAVGKFAVTFGEWKSCVAAGACPSRTNSGWEGEGLPVINVTWFEAKQFVHWLSRMTGEPYRLLSEAEREYATRAGSATAYFWGEEVGRGNANCKGCGSKRDGAQPAPVGSFNPNDFGLYDVHGNVWEWVEDDWHENYETKPAGLKSTGAAWTSEGSKYHVVRGGSWSHEPPLLRSAFRRIIEPSIHDNNFGFGFRVARTLSP